MTLLKSKLSLPRLNQELIPRSALIDRLNQGLNGDVTLVNAPTGYGKTTLVTRWAAQSSLPVAWLGLDEKDNDVDDFLNYLIAAIRTIFPEACPRTLALTQRSPMVIDDVLTSTLVNEIDDLPQRFALVLDDFHCLIQPAIHQLLDEVLRWSPAQMHLLIITRAEPPLTLGWLRARGMLNDIDIQDLRFSDSEAEAYVKQRLGQLDDSVMVALLERAEGWIAGLHLASLSLRHVQDSKAVARLLAKKNNRLVVDYLFEQVLSQQSQEIRNFLIKTSILDRLSPSLARAVVGAEAGIPTTLVEVERAGLFLFALDNSGEWFAYHTLFRDVLRRLLHETHTADEIATLHLRASNWFRRHDQVEVALQHAIAGDDTALVARIVANKVPYYLNTEGWRTLAGWLDYLPSQMIEDNPLLLLAKAYVLTHELKWNAVLPIIKAAEERLDALRSLPDREETAVAEALVYWLYAYYWLGEQEAQKTRDAAQRALEVLPSNYPHLASSNQYVLAVSLQWLGDFDRAERMLDEALQSVPASTSDPEVLFGPLLGLTVLYLSEGYLVRSAQVAEILLHKAGELGVQDMMTWAYLSLGASAYLRNDMTSAITYYDEGVHLRYSSNVVSSQQCLVGLALTHQVMGQSEEARGVLAIMHDYHRELANPTLNVEYRSLRALLALMDGDLATARQWGDITGYDQTRREQGLALGWMVVPAITNIRIRLADDPSPTDLADIIAQLDHLLARLLRLRQPKRQVELLALKATALLAREDRQEAQEALTKALLVAEPRGLLRPILDAGAALEPLLKARARKYPSAYLVSLINAMRPGAAAPFTSLPELPHVTPREREVLVLLSQYKTDRAIAETLVIAPSTVRTHIDNLADKLEVRGRRNIVDRARNMALIS